MICNKVHMYQTVLLISFVHYIGFIFSNEYIISDLNYTTSLDESVSI